MHYTGTIWRPPYEKDSLLLEVTSGCTHHQCKFCTLYNDLPFKFKLSPIEIIEQDLLEYQIMRYNPNASIVNKLKGNKNRKTIKRVFLTGANPFVLKTELLLQISGLIKKYIPTVETIGCFARVTDSRNKTNEELKLLRKAGFTGLTIGAETGDNSALNFMNKGYNSDDILTECKRLEQAGISYSLFYLVGISGKGNGEKGAEYSANIFNQLNPFLIGANMLTVYLESELYYEIQKGNWQVPGEHEKYKELRILIEKLTISTTFAALGASNAFQFWGKLPQDKEIILRQIEEIIFEIDESELINYRKNLPHL